MAYIEWRGRVYLNLEPSNVLVCSGRSLGKTIQVKLANLETCQTVSKNGTAIKGTYNFDYTGNSMKSLMSGQRFSFSFGISILTLTDNDYPFYFQKHLKSLRKLKPTHNQTFGALVYFSMFFYLDNFHSRERVLKKVRPTFWMLSSSLNGSTKKLQWKQHDCSCGSLRDLHGKLPKFSRFEV